MKPLIQRIRWQRIGYLAVAVMAVGAIGFGYYKDSQATQLVEYHRVVESGDTLWSICASIATDKKTWAVWCGRWAVTIKSRIREISSRGPSLLSG